MSLIDYIYTWIAIVITSVLQLLCYKEFSKKPLKINILLIFIILLCSAILLVNIYFNYSFTKLIISFGIIVVNCYFAYKESINIVLVKAMFIYLIMIVVEIILSAVILMLGFESISDFNMNIEIKTLFTIALIIISLLICKIKYIKRISGKLVEKISVRFIIYFYLIVSLLLGTFLAYKFIESFNTSVYLLNLLILTCFSVLIFAALTSYIRTQKVMHQHESLLSFMSKYEKMIDDGRINRHEMLNNLLILRSIKNKNSKGFSELLDDLIKTYDNNKDSIKNIYNLPSGLKGILYYKVFDMKALNISVTLNISKKVGILLKNLNNKEYNSLCRVITILLDNAKDASAVAKSKYILIEFYLENNTLIFSIENTYKDKVDMNKLTTINYSTKGKGRGLGLYIANNIIHNINIMSLEQKIADGKIFSSVLKVNKK